MVGTRPRRRQGTPGLEAGAVRNKLAERLPLDGQHFRLLVEGVSDYGIFMLDPEGIVISWSPAAERIKGYSAEEIIGKHFSCFYPKEGIERGRPEKDLRAALRAGRFEADALRVRKDGTEFWANVIITALRDDAGHLRGFAEVTRDITRRKRAEAAAEQERLRLETLVESSPVGIVVADISGRLVLVNRETERITDSAYKQGDTLETLDQGAVRRRTDGTDYAPQELPIRRALHQGEHVRAEQIWFHFSDGRVVPTLVDAVPIRGARGEIMGAIVVIQDISPLEEVERLRNEFLGMVSHELKTPLTAIKGSAAMALSQRGPLDAVKAQEFFQIIEEQSDLLADLVDNLLDMTRIEAGSLAVSPESTDLGPILQEARSSFVRGGTLHEVKVEVPEDLPPVNADRGRVLQVLSNLLNNAAKFSAEGEPIRITVDREELYIAVHVQDHGRGIPAKKLPYLFKKFSQVHHDQGRGLRGTGLGLAICKGIVEAHGGRIWAESRGLGKGSAFSFTLPVASDTSAASSVQALPPTTRRASAGRTGEKTRVLALDDEPQILRYLRRALDEAGYQALVTSDPEEVTRLVELEEPDLLLLDLMLPGAISGFDVLQHVREISGMPVIVLTASRKPEDTVRALKMGADDYITKPFAPSELLARIEAALRRRLLPDVIEARTPLVLDDLTINFAERLVTVGGSKVSLSATQYKILYELAIHAGQVLTHDQILQRVWGTAYSGEVGLLRSFIRDLRQKLGDDAKNPRHILTEPQVGYRMPKPQS